ncbi:MAG: hypothetical protein ACKODR_12010, partial [Acidimicrobiaceae bacterium]
MQLADDSGSTSKSRYTDQLLSLGRSAGLDQVGVTSATVLHRAREAIYQRIEQGLHNQMQFTFRNPERSTGSVWCKYLINNSTTVLSFASPIL